MRHVPCRSLAPNALAGSPQGRGSRADGPPRPCWLLLAQGLTIPLNADTGHRLNRHEQRKEQNMTKTRIKVATITLAVAIPAFLSGPVLFSPAERGPAPTAGQMPFFVFFGVGDAVLLGLGAAFLI